MPVGRNSVYGPSHAPVYDPAPIHGKRKVYLGSSFDLPPFHQAGFVGSALSPGYPAKQRLIIRSATVTVRDLIGSVVFLVRVNGVDVTGEITVLLAGLSLYTIDVTVEAGDVVTTEIISATGAVDFLVVLRADTVVATPGSAITGPYIEFDTRAWGGGATLANLGSAGSFYNLSVVSFSGSVYTGGVPTATPGQFARNQQTVSFNPWADIGGNADTAGVVFVTAISGRSHTTGPFLTRSGFDTYAEGDIIFNNNSYPAPSHRWYNAILQFQDNHAIADLSYDAQTGFANDVEVDWDKSAGTAPDLADSVVIVAYDAAASLSGMWINGVAVSPTDLSITMPASLPLPSPTFGDIFMYLGDDMPATSFGKWAHGAYASALYRGYPTDTDIAALTARYA